MENFLLEICSAEATQIIKIHKNIHKIIISMV